MKDTNLGLWVGLIAASVFCALLGSALALAVICGLVELVLALVGVI